ncbi:hypothetical protein [Alteromonas ponticola]|uniref:Uncharacterized protein n=1 Tax=Alteromonas ponticola TaxID=2720613 RepID=A0ABX1R144_9ALTE|nr:hypothetical protein [Alteromonas ponticola]NMH58993.1 hypothetical protein [Alteromonas ponticola]
MKLLWFFIAGALGVGGCQNNDDPMHASAVEDHAVSTSDDKIEITTPIGIFSTYLSDSAASQCQLLTYAQTTCEEDAIAAQHFFVALKNIGAFPNALAVSGQSDYQLLIANQAATIASPGWWHTGIQSLKGNRAPLADERQHFTEFTVQWRGLEIDTQLIQTHVAMHEDHTPVKVAEDVIAQWRTDALQRGLFTAPFLYKALRASDYLSEMQVPDTIAAFSRFDTQLFHDPFQGAITRYTHNEYEDALLDITVFPLTTSLDTAIETSLTNILEKEQADAQIVAAARNLTMVVDHPIAEFTPGRQFIEEKVFMLAVHAKGETEEPIFATTYVFRQEDKIVKVSTTFPPRIANPLVEQALPSIKVPAESPLMATLRDIAKTRS